MGSPARIPGALVVHDMGAATPLGLCAASTAAATWAGVSRLAAPQVPLPGHAPLVHQASCPLFAADTALTDRLVGLGVQALTPMLCALDAVPGCLCVFVALPASTLTSAQCNSVVQRLQAALVLLRRGPSLSVQVKALLQTPGQFAQGLSVAARYLAAPANPQLCIIGGIDSGVSPCRIAALLRARQAYDRTTGEGRLPGEAAAFCTLSRAADQAPTPVVAHLTGWHAAQRDSAAPPGASDAHDTGDAKALLTTSVRAALHASDAPAVWVNDDTGELTRAQATAQVYVAAGIPDLQQVTLLEPAQQMGEVGVACGPLSCILAAFGMRFGLSKGPMALVSCQDAGSASAVRVSAAKTYASPLFCAGPWRHKGRC